MAMQSSNGQPMGDKPPEGDKRPTPHPRAQAQSSARRKGQERRRALIAACGMLMVVAASTVIVIAAHSLISGHSSRAPEIAMTSPERDLRTARITRDIDGKGCEQNTFDNQTGRMNRSLQPCDATEYDSNGVPIPLGTIHRLDAINKSFSGR
jgi:hypothetical protein